MSVEEAVDSLLKRDSLKLQLPSILESDAMAGTSGAKPGDVVRI
jgi:DNA-directed RNA polymerase subunit H (RpoH/RPB5)